MQIVGLDDRVMEQIYKHVSVSLCPNTPGQVHVHYMSSCKSCCDVVCCEWLECENLRVCIYR